MTPKLLQRIQILQMPITELVTEVQKQLQENPVVELIEPETAQGGAMPEKTEAESYDDNSIRDIDKTLEKKKEGETPEKPAEKNEIELKSDGVSEYEKDAETVDMETGSNGGIEWEQYFDDLEKTSHREEKEYDWSEQASFENFVSREETLAEHLEEQLNSATFSEREMKVGRIVIGFIDSSGYLKAKTEEIMLHPELADLQLTIEEIEDVIETIQTFEPSGVCARDVRECLIIQYHALDETEKDPLVLKLIENHLEDVSEKRYKNIAQALGVTIQDVQELVDFVVQNFNPKPGLQFASSEGNFNVTPEVFIEKVNGEYVVTVNDYGVPRIRINPRYESIMRSKSASKEVMNFIKEKLDKARFILKSIEQRRDTIKRVVECIVRHQHDFFEHGISHFKPLILNEVAQEVSLDESTVSRVTSGKYAQTPRGVLELKFFFSTGLHSSTGEDVSTKSVKDMIKTMVLAEPADRPLSDQTIVEELEKKGIKIARRTVTKYREELNIPSSSKRKRYS